MNPRERTKLDEDWDAYIALFDPPNPYPRGTYAHDAWEFHEEVVGLGHALLDTFLGQQMIRFLTWLNARLS